MLVVELHELRDGPVTRREVVSDPAGLWPELDVRFQGPLRLRFRVEEARGDGLRVTGRCRATVALSCRRCLTGIERRLRVPFEIGYRPGAARGEEWGEAVFPLEPEARAVDLAEALREEILLALPTYPVCRAECGGLCPKCGVRRDDEECGCSFDEPDPRWDALRALR